MENINQPVFGQARLFLHSFHDCMELRLPAVQPVHRAIILANGLS